MSTTAATTATEQAPLSPAEFRAYNHMSEHMNYFHDHFRAEWNALYSAVSPTPWGQSKATLTPDSASPAKPLSASRIINTGLSFLSKLEMHHSIEEQHIFPVLARKMDAFRPDSRHLNQHKQIHAGLDQLDEYLNQVRTGERELRRDEVRTCMDSWGGVLWEHLDEEVQTLGADNMRRFWTLAEMRQMPM